MKSFRVCYYIVEDKKKKIRKNSLGKTFCPSNIFLKLKSGEALNEY